VESVHPGRRGHLGHEAGAELLVEEPHAVIVAQVALAGRDFSRTISTMRALASVDRAPALAFGLFVILTTTLVAYHEPWRDEADAWLMARDASVGRLFHYAGYSGAPALWYLIQMPFAKAGAAYPTQRYLHLVIALAAAGLLLFRAPFSLPLRLALAFGYFFSFEYTVVARNYSTGILLCFAALTMDPHRARLAPLYGLLIGLAANSSAHFMFFAAALLVPLAWEAWTRRVERRLWLGVALGGAGVAFTLWQLLPPPDGQMPPAVFATFEPHNLQLMLTQSLTPGHFGRRATMLGLLVLALMAARLWFAPRAAVVFALSTASLAYVFVFKYSAGVRHFGLFLVAIVVTLWMAEGDSASAARTPRLLRRVVVVVLVVALLPSVLLAARTWRMEIKDPYSEAGDMARFITASRLERAWIAAFTAPHGESVLAFLPPRTFWYPAIGEAGSHMKWDARYQAARGMPVEEALARLKAQRPQWADPRAPALLLLSRPFADPAGEGYRLLYCTPGRAWGDPSETYCLYVPLTVARPPAD
jgi:hypothetical protein